MIKKYYIRMLVILAMLALVLLAWKKSNHNEYHNYTNNFTCSTNLVVHRPYAKLAVIITYFINDSKGIAFLEGSLERDGNVVSVNRKSYFEVQQSQNLLQATSTKVLRSPADNANTSELQHLLPLFYLREKAQLEFSIYPQKNKGFLFFTTNVPSFYCV